MSNQTERLPICPRCGIKNNRFFGKSVVMPFTTPNRFFNPDIYTLELNNFVCQDCMKLLKDAIIKWWKSGNYYGNTGIEDTQ